MHPVIYQYLKGFQSPEMTEFKFKLVDKLGNTLDMLKYKLKEGRELPCSVILKGTYFL